MGLIDQVGERRETAHFNDRIDMEVSIGCFGGRDV